ncbi:MAG TPA: universal stress protein [Candidatus Binatia bacterium]|nr:universal stress protein [Candidatus Binatia bacterium]
MIKRILVPVDFSQTSLQALDYAIEFGKPFKPEIVVVFVVEPIYFTAPTDLYAPAANVGMLIEEQRRIGREQLAGLAADLKKRRVNARTILQTGTAHQVITDTAKRLKADLIIMATHGRTGLSHAFLGSVAERVVRHAQCPVLTVRGTKRRRAK